MEINDQFQASAVMSFVLISAVINPGTLTSSRIVLRCSLSSYLLHVSSSSRPFPVDLPQLTEATST